MGTKSKNKAVVLCTGGDGCTVCGFGCLGDGKCAEVCRFDAISINTFNVAEVDREKCRGCGLCVKACPQNIIDLVPAEDSYSPRCSNHDKGAEAKKICSSSCIACRICEKACPSGAIAVTDNCAVINHEKCISCGMCATVCPRGVIIDADGIMTAAKQMR
jgi:Formate hydrogenlyase subunit 6/NADH:ubiquinone oxidoreductase 23 kD subunit (chain I)